MSRLPAAGFVLLLVFAIVGCRPLSRPWGELVVEPGQPVRIGVSVDADTGTDETGSTRSSLEKDQFQVYGHDLRLVPIPVHCQAGTPAGVAPPRQLLSGLAGYIGSACSKACIYTEGLLYEERTTMVASGCTAGAVVQQGFPSVFRIAWDDDDQALVAADYARSALRAHRVAVVRDTSVYARSLTAAFAQRFRSKGGEVREVEIPVLGTVDVAQVTARVRASGAGAVFLTDGRSDSADHYAALLAALAPLPVIASDTVLGDGRTLPPNGLLSVGLARRNGAWVSELDLRSRAPTLFDAEEEDAVRLYAAAIGTVAAPRADGALVIERERLRDALAHLDTIGQTGRISFDSKGERRHDTGAAVYRVSDGQATLLSEYKR